MFLIKLGLLFPALRVFSLPAALTPSPPDVTPSTSVSAPTRPITEGIERQHGDGWGERQSVRNNRDWNNYRNIFSNPIIDMEQPGSFGPNFPAKLQKRSAAAEAETADEPSSRLSERSMSPALGNSHHADIYDAGAHRLRSSDNVFWDQRGIVPTLRPPAVPKPPTKKTTAEVPVQAPAVTAEEAPKAEDADDTPAATREEASTTDKTPKADGSAPATTLDKTPKAEAAPAAHPTVLSMVNAMRTTQNYLDALSSIHRIELHSLIEAQRAEAEGKAQVHRESILAELRKYQAQLQDKIRKQEPLEQSLETQVFIFERIMSLQRDVEKDIVQKHEDALIAKMAEQQQAERHSSSSASPSSSSSAYSSVKEDNSEDDARHRRYTEKRLVAIHRALLSAVKQEHRLTIDSLTASHQHVLHRFAEKQRRAAERLYTDRIHPTYYPGCTEVDGFGRARYLYRLDARPPSEIRALGGFYPARWYAGMDVSGEAVSLVRHARGLMEEKEKEGELPLDRGGYVSLTCSAAAAKRAAIDALAQGPVTGLREVWIYVVAATTSSINVRSALRLDGGSSGAMTTTTASTLAPAPSEVRESDQAYANLGPVEYDRIVYQRLIRSVDVPLEPPETKPKFGIEERDSMSRGFDEQRYADTVAVAAEDEASPLAAVVDLINDDDDDDDDDGRDEDKKEPPTCVVSDLDLAPPLTAATRAAVEALLRQRQVPAASCSGFAPKTYRWAKYLIETLGREDAGESPVMIQLRGNEILSSPSEKPHEGDRCLSADSLHDVEPYGEVSWAPCSALDADQMWTYVASTGRLRHAYRNLCVVPHWDGGEEDERRAVARPCSWEEPRTDRWTVRTTSAVGEEGHSRQRRQLVVPPGQTTTKEQRDLERLICSLDRIRFCWLMRPGPLRVVKSSCQACL